MFNKIYEIIENKSYNNNNKLDDISIQLVKKSQNNFDEESKVNKISEFDLNNNHDNNKQKDNCIKTES